ncbi:MAG: hypothetical protein RLZZ623_336 [Actinomycetota bacterium]|jgi:hypothetical protein
MVIGKIALSSSDAVGPSPISSALTTTETSLSLLAATRRYVSVTHTVITSTRWMTRTAESARVPDGTIIVANPPAPRSIATRFARLFITALS